MIADQLSRIDALKNGDGPTWTALLVEYRPQIGRYARRMGVSDADDVTGATLESVARGIGEFTGGEAQFRSWIFTLAHARIVDNLRRRSRRPEIELRPIDERRGTDQTETILGGDERIAVALEQLTSSQRTLLRYRYESGLSVREIAIATQRSEQATRVALHRCSRRLRELLSPEPSVSP
jgi:RNA polymerase sigma-70 factor (ECF subfamily)